MKRKIKFKKFSPDPIPVKNSHLSTDNILKGKGTYICIAPLRENLTPEALTYGSQCFYTANTPYMPLPRKRSPSDATTV